MLWQLAVLCVMEASLKGQQHLTTKMKDVSGGMEKNTELITTVKAYKLEYVGHTMRNKRGYGLLQNISQGRFLGNVVQADGEIQG
ncbi:hypothetical protein Trydic_g11394 [Trypoxylus dichotomus]